MGKKRTRNRVKKICTIRMSEKNHILNLLREINSYFILSINIIHIRMHFYIFYAEKNKYSVIFETRKKNN